MTPPRYGGEFRGEFFMKKQGSEGIGGIFGFSADGDAPLRYGGGFLGVRRGLILGFRGDWGENPLRLGRGYLTGIRQPGALKSCFCVNAPNFAWANI